MSVTDIARSRAYADALLAKAQGKVRYICQDGEYDQDGKPVIENPDANTTYYVPRADASASDKYAEWEYLNGALEKTGSGAIPEGEYATKEDLQNLDQKVENLAEDVTEHIDEVVEKAAEKALPDIAQDCVQDALDTALAVVIF